jgi:hypothetical protein
MVQVIGRFSSSKYIKYVHKINQTDANTNRVVKLVTIKMITAILADSQYLIFQTSKKIE